MYVLGWTAIRGVLHDYAFIYISSPLQKMAKSFRGWKICFFFFKNCGPIRKGSVVLTPRSLLLVPRQQNMLAVSPVWAVMLGSHLAGVISVPASGAQFCEETDTPLSAPAVWRNEESEDKYKPVVLTIMWSSVKFSLSLLEEKSKDKGLSYPCWPTVTIR